MPTPIARAALRPAGANTYSSDKLAISPRQAREAATAVRHNSLDQELRQVLNLVAPTLFEFQSPSSAPSPKPALMFITQSRRSSTRQTNRRQHQERWPVNWCRHPAGILRRDTQSCLASRTARAGDDAGYRSFHRSRT